MHNYYSVPEKKKTQEYKLTEFLNTEFKLCLISE